MDTIRDRTSPSIEVSTVSNPDIPIDPTTPDDDPTGVRALLSALPEPSPMPEYLVARITASLAAEQAQRAGRFPGSSVTPLLAAPRRRPGRPLLLIAGAAAAVALIAVASSNLLAGNQANTTSGSAAIGRPYAGPEASAQSPPAAAGQREADKSAAGLAAAPPVVQIRTSGTRYTGVDFVTQAQALRATTVAPAKPFTGALSGATPARGASGLTECLSAIGAAGAQDVRADFAYYEGRPALILVATTNGRPTAYVVGRQCSRTDPAVLRAATPLP